MKYVYMALGVIALWASSLLWVHHEGVAQEQQKQAKRVEQQLKGHKKIRQKAEDSVNAMPTSPTVPVATAPPGSAASELLRDWTRDD